MILVSRDKLCHTVKILTVSGAVTTFDVETVIVLPAERTSTGSGYRCGKLLFELNDTKLGNWFLCFHCFKVLIILFSVLMMMIHTKLCHHSQRTITSDRLLTSYSHTSFLLYCL